MANDIAFFNRNVVAAMELMTPQKAHETVSRPLEKLSEPLHKAAQIGANAANKEAAEIVKKCSDTILEIIGVKAEAKQTAEKQVLNESNEQNGYTPGSSFGR
ncbi:MAG: hypothetical protein QM652_03815 [Legionella sp.]|uniref:hypothetical protein n=1 Tax=Legionella sp. TaxID=459 RepID=UPI0039E42069